MTLLHVRCKHLPQVGRAAPWSEAVGEQKTQDAKALRAQVSSANVI